MGEAFALIIDLALKRELSARGQVCRFAVDGTWTVAINGTTETVDGVPPFHVYVEFNGFPAGILGMESGCIAAGEAANEDTLIDALRAAGAEVPE